jgi:hypothetical protein
MSFRNKLSTEDVNFILDKAKQGFGYTDICRMIDGKVSRQRIKQICQKNNIDAFVLKQQRNEKDKITRMTEKWGVQWKDKEYRRSYIYLAMRHKFRSKKANAKRSGKPFDIEFGDIEFPTHCPILNIELDYFAEQQQENSPSFDCIIPQKGYVKGNVVLLSNRANRIKNDGSAEEHRAIADFIDASIASAS